MKKCFLANSIELTVCLLILSLSIWLETKVLISGDITWLMHVGEKFLASGRYYTNFFEVNPPMCIYIYLIPVLASQLLHISFITSVTFYTFIIAISSWLFCHQLLKKILVNAPIFYRANLAIMLTFVYFLLPMNAFGQREYLFIVLMMPYIFIAVLRAKQQPCSKWLAITAGLLAGIGLAQKPFFLPTWLLIELYLAIKFKTLFYWLRSETVAIICILITYAISIPILTPEYINKIIPIINLFYYNNYYFPFVFLLFRPTVIYSIFLFIIYCFFRNKTQQKELLDILIISSIGCFILYLAQHTIWFYHVLPLLMISSLLAVTFLNEHWHRCNLFSIEKLNHQLFKVIFINSLLILLILFPIIGGAYGILTAFKQANTFFERPILQFTQKTPGKTIFIFTEDLTTNYPLFDYTSTNTPSRFPSLWLLTAVDKRLAREKMPAIQQAVKSTQNFVINATINDLTSHQPDYIFIEQLDNYYFIRKKNSLVYKMNLVDKHPAINHFNMFMQNTQFKQFWRKYRHLGEISDFSVYQKIE